MLREAVGPKRFSSPSPPNPYTLCGRCIRSFSHLYLHPFPPYWLPYRGPWACNTSDSDCVPASIEKKNSNDQMLDCYNSSKVRHVLLIIWELQKIWVRFYPTNSTNFSGKLRECLSHATKPSKEVFLRMILGTDLLISDCSPWIATLRICSIDSLSLIKACTLDGLTSISTPCHPDLGWYTVASICRKLQSEPQQTKIATSLNQYGRFVLLCLESLAARGMCGGGRKEQALTDPI
ncbi:hypothetical protein VTK73DRAFT_1105 [Phialemonium thermophilum]|uniref:Uncharacterized protein n=1 Tax=Phialemonium thermophilum TaxID=223376 RepID=A0ABR3XAY5_9PEZI